MTIRYLAEQLYLLNQRVQELEEILAALGEVPSTERAKLEAELFQARKERDHYRAVLESKKEKPLV
jgi:hypothetical protein